MRPRSRLLLVLVAAASALLLVPVTAGADSGGGGDHHGDRLLRGQLVGSTPLAQDGKALFGVNPGTLPWVIGESTVRVSRDGDLRVEMEGLVIPIAPFSGTNPLAAVAATLVCNGVPGTATAAAPLSTAGDGEIEAMVTVPSPCLAPAVLVGPLKAPGVLNAYIAANG